MTLIRIQLISVFCVTQKMETKFDKPKATLMTLTDSEENIKKILPYCRYVGLVSVICFYLT